MYRREGGFERQSLYAQCRAISSLLYFFLLNRNVYKAISQKLNKIIIFFGTREIKPLLLAIKINIQDLSRREKGESTQYK